MEPPDLVADKFQYLVDTPSDINQHLTTLKRLSSNCESVIEMGVRGGFSTYALLAGRPKTMQSFDINPIGVLENNLVSFSQHTGTDWFFYHENVLLTDNVHDCDMLFIDTWHAYKQLASELYLHGNKARKYLVFHDVITFGSNDELGSLNTTSFSDDLKSFVEKLPNKTGLMPAINEFLERNPHWQIQAMYPYNNGLMVLERR